MAFSEAHVLYAVKLGATLLGGVIDQSLSQKTTFMEDTANGLPYTTHLAISAQEPEARFSTRALAEAFALVGPAGASIAALSGGAILYAQKVTQGGTRASGANHRSYTLNAGVIYPDKLSCQHQKDAELSYALRPTWNGTNNPYVLGDSVSLPASPTDAERFTLGPVSIAGTVYDQLDAVDIDFGVKIRAESADGEVWPRFAWIETYAPTVTFRGRKVRWFADSGGVPSLGAVHTHANTAFYLRKRASGGTFVADLTAQHIKFTAAGIAVIDDPATFRGTGPGETTLTLKTYYDGTNHPILVNYASAIS